MRLLANLNSSGNVSGSSVKPPKQPGAEEYPGTAFLVSSNGDILDPKSAQSQSGTSQLWLLTCSIVNSSDAVICCVDAIYSLVGMSDPFQLSSGRTGSSVTVILRSKPGRRPIDDVALVDQVSVINVHFADSQFVLNNALVFLPAHGQVAADGTITSQWSYAFPHTKPDAIEEGQLLWKDAKGQYNIIYAVRAMEGELRMISPGDIMNQSMFGRYGGVTFNTTLPFGIPFGLNCATPDPDNTFPVQYLLWLCWYKIEGSHLSIGYLPGNSAINISPLEGGIRIDDVAVLRPVLYGDTPITMG